MFCSTLKLNLVFLMTLTDDCGRSIIFFIVLLTIIYDGSITSNCFIQSQASFQTRTPIPNFKLYCRDAEMGHGIVYTGVVQKVGLVGL